MFSENIKVLALEVLAVRRNYCRFLELICFLDIRIIIITKFCVTRRP